MYVAVICVRVLRKKKGKGKKKRKKMGATDVREKQKERRECPKNELEKKLFLNQFYESFSFEVVTSCTLPISDNLFQELVMSLFSCLCILGQISGSAK